MTIRFLFVAIALIQSFSVLGQKGAIPTIDVTGEAQLLIDPEEIIFSITIEEYWKEEFEGKKWEDYKTKIQIEVIENSLIKELEELGIRMDQIVLKNTGNYWRQRGKDFLINKQLEITLADFSKANEIANKVETRGIKTMNVTQLKHPAMDSLQAEVQKLALLDAKNKASELLKVIDKSLGDVLSIVEIDRNAGIILKNHPAMARADMAMMEASAPAVEYENFRKLKLHSEVRVMFAIEEDH